MVRDNRRESVYLFGAICPDRAVGAAIIMPAVNTEAMNAHLQEISTQVAPGAHALLLCDRAGWHATSRGLQVPVNMTRAYPVETDSHQIWCPESQAEGIHRLQVVGVCANRIGTT